MTSTPRHVAIVASAPPHLPPPPLPPHCTATCPRQTRTLPLGPDNAEVVCRWLLPLALHRPPITSIHSPVSPLPLRPWRDHWWRNHLSSREI
uniref:Uncharacterized protein n=1 Tax=Oryza meridionalis TaxID=40149 RepID=A0A0E0ECL6_9ORYZ